MAGHTEQNGGVVRLATKDDRYKEAVLERLTDLMESAYRGEILSISYVCERPGEKLSFGSSHIKNRYLLLGFLAQMMHQTHLSIDADAVPSNLLDGDGA